MVEDIIRNTNNNIETPDQQLNEKETGFFKSLFSFISHIFSIVLLFVVGTITCGLIYRMVECMINNDSNEICKAFDIISKSLF